MPRPSSGERKQEILETFAHLLQQERGRHITTAMLAQKVGVSEAALYRHFSGKAQIFEALFSFIEETLFTRINRILAESHEVEQRLYAIISLILGFADRNPGISRLLYGDVLIGESESLQKRAAQLLDRVEAEIKKVIRDASLVNARPYSAADAAQWLMAIIEGRIAQYIRSGFQRSPTAQWEEHWALVQTSLFPDSHAE